MIAVADGTTITGRDTARSMGGSDPARAVENATHRTGHATCPRDQLQDGIATPQTHLGRLGARLRRMIGLRWLRDLPAKYP
jgi:hypothetical protein